MVNKDFQLRERKGNLVKKRRYPRAKVRVALCIQTRNLSWCLWDARQHLFQVISPQFTLEICVAAWNRWKLLKTRYFVCQCRLRSSMFVPPKSSSALPVMQVCVYCESICNRSHGTRVMTGKITISYGVPLFDALVRGKSSHRAIRNLVAKKLDTPVYAIIRWKPGVSISFGLDSVPGCDVQTDRRTTRQNYNSYPRLALQVCCRA